MTKQRSCILVGVDFSPSSRRAAAWAARQLGPDADIILMHAVDIPAPAVVSGSLEHRIQRVETARRGAHTLLAELAATLGATSVRLRIRAGRPARELARAARETGADVIVVGEASRRQGLERALGSTVEGLLKRAPVPVLLARPATDQPITRILAAVDNSPRAAHVTAETQRLAAHFRAGVTVLHVIPAGLVGVTAVAAFPTEHRRAVGALEKQAVAVTEAHVAALRAAGTWAESLCLQGEPGQRILRAAEEIGADLIVVGLRRASRLERAMFGEVAQRVLKGARCSVLVATEPMSSLKAAVRASRFGGRSAPARRRT